MSSSSPHIVLVAHHGCVASLVKFSGLAVSLDVHSAAAIASLPASSVAAVALPEVKLDDNPTGGLAPYSPPSLSTSPWTPRRTPPDGEILHLLHLYYLVLATEGQDKRQRRRRRGQQGGGGRGVGRVAGEADPRADAMADAAGDGAAGRRGDVPRQEAAVQPCRRHVQPAYVTACWRSPPWRTTPTAPYPLTWWRTSRTGAGGRCSGWRATCSSCRRPQLEAVTNCYGELYGDMMEYCGRSWKPGTGTAPCWCMTAIPPFNPTTC
ncbi:Os06g0569300 [Oryza sativa Japonica Group]|uniref:Os06g0569300 protein n=3 Tax=Oryza sativa TaxID=4530 RepID=A0A0P0WY58_ORYSJ|nr:hypothetical protein OsI_23421 [Oryza sativa Indica Group]EAZ37409.1 hypothetical protein OsJ_21745 [Oryza sativa Japonica Group]KAB8102849.1 hypothetical protein EE612_034900 [Oryza sativa]BAD54590.1 hypothetical protein [Oryza sativa Japonica Group]BAH93581.1 Os06g0569300 [Oryza sativa Japonica Group]|eukprot:NP_001174853.1 Os06g0569300 [Oryza sativa Japonica Group]